jgi:hypothetical protein
MTLCGKLFLMNDRNTGHSVIVFLENAFNYFDRKYDWFPVRIVGGRKNARREEKKIPGELAFRLEGVVYG